MQLPTLLLESIKSGKLTVSEHDVPQIEIKAEGKRIDINITNKQLLKEIISSAREAGSKGSIVKRIEKSAFAIKEARETSPVVKEMVEDFCKEGVTIRVSYKGERVATIGSEADSMLTRLVTGTKGIQIDSPTRLAELGI